MTGSLLQLVAVGNEDIFITGNPQITFFKSIYKKFINFSMESMDLVFASVDKTLSYDNPTRLYINIPENGDILSHVFLRFTLPDITISKKFRWIRNIGSAIINYAKIYIGGQLIEEVKGDYITAYYNTSLTDIQLETYNKLIGNIESLYNPTSDSTSLSGREICVSLPFWFTKNKGAYFPLCAIDNQEVRLEIELKPIKEIYIVDISDDVNRVQLGKPINKNHEIRYFMNNNSSNEWSLKPILDTNYIFVDDDEKYRLKNNIQNQLIEVVNYREFLGKSGNVTLEVEMFHLTKDIMILARRDDVKSRNQHSNYTNFDSIELPNYYMKNNANWIYRNTTPVITKDNYKNFDEKIINKLEIRFNGDLRLEPRDYDYFNKVQPFNHYKNTYPGILLYSFSIDNSKYQPMGACNFTEIRRVEFLMDIKNPKLYEDAYQYQYDIMFFTKTYNILKIQDGLCKLSYRL